MAHPPPITGDQRQQPWNAPNPMPGLHIDLSAGAHSHEARYVVPEIRRQWPNLTNAQRQYARYERTQTSSLLTTLYLGSYALTSVGRDPSPNLRTRSPALKPFLGKFISTSLVVANDAQSKVLASRHSVICQVPYLLR
jgi:hypothetical protein